MLPRHVYVHVPFCARRCSYCDFAIAVRRDVPVDEYLGALRAELELRFPRDAGPWVAETLYLGGGTPSRLGAEGVARAVAMLRERIELAAGAEVTLEANPEDVDAGAARRWVEAGVNRVSLGAQSFEDRVLAWMHRVHDAERVGRAVGALREAGIDNLSLDLIFALPRALERDWRRDVDRALALEPEHLSLYGLTVEPHTPLGRWRERGAVEEASEEGYEEEYLHAHAALAAAGLEHYEVSNFGRPGLHSRHNRSYWSGVAYAGLGPGAHELALDGAAATRRWNVGAYAAWTRALGEGRDPAAGSETLTAENRVAEDVYLGLRASGGLTLSGGAMRTIYVEVRGEIADNAVAEVSWVLNDRLAGLTLREIRSSLGPRLRDSGTPAAGAQELLNIFVQEGEQLFDVGSPGGERDLVLGQASLLAEQPEFATQQSLRRLLELTDTRQDLAALLRQRSGTPGLRITIGNEHDDPRLENFTVVTAEYHAGPLSGVIGVIGPTRMPYEKVIAMVNHTSSLISDLLE